MMEPQKNVYAIAFGRSLVCYKRYLTHEETSSIQGKSWILSENILRITYKKIDPALTATTTHSTNMIIRCK